MGYGAAVELMNGHSDVRTASLEPTYPYLVGERTDHYL